MRDPFCPAKGTVEVILPVPLRGQMGKPWLREGKDFPEAMEQVTLAQSSDPVPAQLCHSIQFNKL